MVLGKASYDYPTHTRSLETRLKFYNPPAKHDMEMKFTSSNFSCQVAEGSRGSWLQILRNQLIDRSPYINTNRKYHSLYNST